MKREKYISADERPRRSFLKTTSTATAALIGFTGTGVAHEGTDHKTTGTLEFPARRVGALPRGTYHDASRWGIHFRTEKPIHLGQTTVDADQSGSFTAAVGRYDGNDLFDPVHEREISVDAGLNEIDLDMAVEPGEYLLIRDGSFPLRRGEWSGWESQSRDGLELLGGSKPGDYSANRFWYYFFDLTVTGLRYRGPYHD